MQTATIRIKQPASLTTLIGILKGVDNITRDTPQEIRMVTITNEEGDWLEITFEDEF